MKISAQNNFLDFEKLGLNLRKRRKAKSLTQEELAESAHVSTRQVQNLEYGKVDVRLSTLAKICRALELPFELLMAGIDSFDKVQAFPLCCELFSSEAYAMVMTDLEGKILNLTDKAFQLFSSLEIKPEYIWSLCHDNDDAEFLKSYIFFMAEKEKPITPYLVVAKDNNNNFYYYKLRFSYIFQFDQSLKGFFVFLTFDDRV